jgi:hypothetical protein
MLLQCSPYFNFGHTRIRFLKLVKRVEYRLPVVIGEVVLDLLDIHVCCPKPVCGGEVICAWLVVAAAVQEISALDLEESEWKYGGGQKA